MYCVNSPSLSEPFRVQTAGVAIADLKGSAGEGKELLIRYVAAPAILSTLLPSGYKQSTIEIHSGSPASTAFGRQPWDSHSREEVFLEVEMVLDRHASVSTDLVSVMHGYPVDTRDTFVTRECLKNWFYHAV